MAIEQICGECGFDASAASPADVASSVPVLAVAIAHSLRSIPEHRARTRPAPDVWAPVEYLGHLRESMAFHRWLIEKALSEDNPLIPMVDPDASVAEANYRDSDIDELIGQFDRRVQRLCELLQTIDHEATLRTVRLDGTTINTALVSRSAWHECHHHHGDIQRLGSAELADSK
jgi:DinB superfamily